MKKDLQLIPTRDMTRDDWLRYRFTGLGASEIGTILGLDDYTSSLELFYQKIGDTPRLDVESIAAFMGREQEDFVANLWQYWGGDEESMINNYRMDKIVRRCRRVNAYIRNPAYPWLFVSLDRIANKFDGKDEGVLELKTLAGWEANKWESGLPPKHVLQVQTQLLVTGLSWGEMAILQDGRRFMVFPFEVSQNIHNAVVQRTRDFWNRIEKGRKLVNEKYQALVNFNYKVAEEASAEIDNLAPAPDGSLAYERYLSEKYKLPSKMERRGTAEELDHALKALDLAGRIKELDEAKRLAENSLKSSMGNYQVLDFAGSGKLYWTTNSAGRRIFINKVKP